VSKVENDAASDDVGISEIGSSRHIPGDRHQRTGDEIADRSTLSPG
jgi:hypothetical protein